MARKKAKWFYDQVSGDLYYGRRQVATLFTEDGRPIFEKEEDAHRMGYRLAEAMTRMQEEQK